MTQAYSKPLAGYDEETKPFWTGAKTRAACAEVPRLRQLYYPVSPICPTALTWALNGPSLAAKAVYSFIVVREGITPASTGHSVRCRHSETEEGIRMLSTWSGQPDAVKIACP